VSIPWLDEVALSAKYFPTDAHDEAESGALGFGAIGHSCRTDSTFALEKVGGPDPIPVERFEHQLEEVFDRVREPDDADSSCEHEPENQRIWRLNRPGDSGGGVSRVPRSRDFWNLMPRG